MMAERWERFGAGARAWVLRDSRLLPGRAPFRGVIGLSNAARGSVLWVAICGLLALRPGVSRRASVRGLTAVAVAAVASHLLGLVLVRRDRPRAAHLAARRALPEQPGSSSFPSAHATCAAAFATALGMESPVLGATVAPLAGVVAYARVRTRVHWPTDVLAGAALGTVTAVLTRRLPVQRSARVRRFQPARLRGPSPRRGDMRLTGGV